MAQEGKKRVVGDHMRRSTEYSVAAIAVVGTRSVQSCCTHSVDDEICDVGHHSAMEKASQPRHVVAGAPLQSHGGSKPLAPQDR